MLIGEGQHAYQDNPNPELPVIQRSLRRVRELHVPRRPNGAGKSTILCALNIFFREIDGTSTSTTDLDEEDFHNRDTSHPIEITIPFCDLTLAAQTEFAEYYRQGERIFVFVRQDLDFSAMYEDPVTEALREIRRERNLD